MQDRAFKWTARHLWTCSYWLFCSLSSAGLNPFQEFHGLQLIDFVGKFCSCQIASAGQFRSKVPVVPMSASVNQSQLDLCLVCIVQTIRRLVVGQICGCPACWATGVLDNC